MEIAALSEGSAKIAHAMNRARGSRPQIHDSLRFWVRRGANAGPRRPANREHVP
jgi:hypothetical protein